MLLSTIFINFKCSDLWFTSLSCSENLESETDSTSFSKPSTEAWHEMPYSPTSEPENSHHETFNSG